MAIKKDPGLGSEQDKHTETNLQMVIKVRTRRQPDPDRDGSPSLVVLIRGFMMIRERGPGRLHFF